MTDLFSLLSPAFGAVTIFSFGSSDGCVVTCRLDFNLHFPIDPSAFKLLGLAALQQLSDERL